MNIDDVKFDDKGLIPAVIQNASGGKVLMLGYMNRESLALTLEKRLCCFYSRSRRQLWWKGETSGNRLHVISVTADCDADALLIKVNPDGPTCHTGKESCFFEAILPGDEAFTLDALYTLIQGRKTEKKEGSYTTYLFDKGLDKILKKVGEEATEVIIAGKGGNRRETVYEIADLAYHLLVLMVQQEISTQDILDELASRHVIDHKIKQEGMPEAQ
jgi:phosphoribosyl-ATP pyrophosphohydrolase/phosphoribosyl-AMP cyclohydrolase